MKNLHITCSTLKQRQDVFDVLEGMGFKSDGRDMHYLRVQTIQKQLIWRTWALGSPLENSEELTYKQFMEQYGMQKLRNAITATKLSNPQLSLKLGHSRKYITNLLNDGCSTELQKHLIEEISQIMAGTFKTDAEVIAELSAKLAEAQDTNIANITIKKQLVESNVALTNAYGDLKKSLITAMEESDGYYAQLHEQKDANISLKNKIESTQEVLGAEIKGLDSANTELNEEIKILSDERIGLLSANTELNEELNATRQTIAKLDSNLKSLVNASRNDAHEFLELKRQLHTSDEQNDHLRAAIGKQKVLAVLALLLVVAQAAIIWSLV